MKIKGGLLFLIDFPKPQIVDIRLIQKINENPEMIFPAYDTLIANEDRLRGYMFLLENEEVQI